MRFILLHRRWTFNEFQYTGAKASRQKKYKKIDVLPYTCLLITPGCRLREKKELMQPAWESFTCGCFPTRTALKCAYIYISIMESISWMMRALQQRMCDMKTSHLLCCCSEFGISGRPDEDGSERSNRCFCSRSVRLIVSAGVTQYLICDLHAPDWGSRRAAKQKASLTSSRPSARLPVDRQREFYLFQCVYPVCFILMPPCCQSDKTFATEAVSVHLRQIGSPHCFWMIILQHHVSHWFIFKESRYYFFIDRPFFINKDDI